MSDFGLQMSMFKAITKLLKRRGTVQYKYSTGTTGDFSARDRGSFSGQLCAKKLPCYCTCAGKRYSSLFTFLQNHPNFSGTMHAITLKFEQNKLYGRLDKA